LTPEGAPPPAMAADPAAEFAACCHELRTLRAAGEGLSPRDGRPALALLGRLAALPVSRPLLLASGAGKEVNRAWLRGHPCLAVREHSRCLVRCWRQLLTMQAAGAAAAASAGAAGATAPGAAAAEAAAAVGEEGEAVTGDPAPDGQSDALRRRPVAELKARLAALGVSCGGCVEKADLVALLVAAGGGSGLGGPPRRRRSLLGVGASRLSRGRKSVLKVISRGKKAQPTEAAGGKAQLEARLRRIAKATEDTAALGLSRAQLQALSPEARAKLVQQRWRSLALHAHPDKVPERLRELAARAFARLDAAKARLLAGSGR